MSPAGRGAPGGAGAPRGAGRAGLPAALLALLLALALAAGAVAAQTSAPAQPDYASWESFASTTERRLDAGTAGDATLRALRAQAAGWRETFLAAQKTRSTRLATLREQIAALGPAPAEGKTEPADVAARRAKLQAEIEVEQAPALRATEAYGRADGLVTQIDRAQRARQASARLRLSPSPLLPSSWVAAVGDGVTLLTGLTTDAAAGIDAAGGLRGLAPRLPRVAGLLALAGVLLVVGRRFVNRLPSILSVRAATATRGVAVFVASLAQIALPVAGVWLIARALAESGLVGAWGLPLLQAAPVAGLTLFAGRWLGHQLFPLDAAQPALFDLARGERARARRQSILLGAVLAAHQLIARPLLPLSGYADPPAGPPRVPVPFGEASAAVWHLPLILLGALCLVRLARLLVMPPPRAGEPAQLRERLVAGFAVLARGIGYAAPVVAAVGFVALANAALWPAVLTLALLGLAAVLQEFVADLWGLIRGESDSAREGLVPAIAGFALYLVMLPLLALVWGARRADLAELWTRIAKGLTIGTVHISPGGIVSFAAVFLLGYVLTRAVQGGLKSSVLPKTRIAAGGQAAIISGLGYVGIFLSALLAIVAAGIDLGSLAIVAGALSVGIGFGLQNIVSNFVSGIILLIERPVAVGDWIRVGAAEGYVRRISVRSTSIQTFDRTEVVVPNSDLITQQVTNWTRGSLSGRVIVPVTVAWGADTRRVEAILHEIAEAQPTVLVDPGPLVLFTGFGADGLNFELRAILADINQGSNVASEVRHQMLERFAAEGIALPFAQRDLWMRNLEAVAETVAQEAGSVTGAPPAGRPGGRPAAPGPRAAPVTDATLDPRIARATGSGIEDMPGDDGDATGPTA